MAQQGIHLDQEKICCSICLDLLKSPVTIPCGHNYCMNCIKSHWDGEDRKEVHSCPQCRQTFIPRPVLVKNTMLADLVEDLKKTGLQAAPGDLCYAGPEDVSCDVCTGRKLKAIKSCLQCQVSYCEQHLQPHYESPAFDKHKLLDPSKKLQENICSRHNEVMKIFCRTDQQCICYLCSMDEHKGHDIVVAEGEWTERQKKLETSQQKIQQRIQDRENDVKLLQQEVEAINRSADKSVMDSEKIFTELVRLIKKKSSDVKQLIRSQENIEVSRVKDLQEKLQQEIIELRRKDAELEELSNTDDHIQFLQNYPSLSQVSESAGSPIFKIRPLRYFEDVTAAVSEVRDKLQDILSKVRTKISETEVDVLLPQAEPETRDGFLQYSCPVTLDPNTAHRELSLSEGDRKVTVYYLTSLVASARAVYGFKGGHDSHKKSQSFLYNCQALSRESLTGRCYWEVEWSSEVFVAVAYKDISEEGKESAFGDNDKSWALRCFHDGYEFRHNNIRTSISGLLSSRVGVYLDHSAGVLSFYSVSETMTLLHRVQTTFTEPLYAGLWLCYRSTAELK